MSDEWDSVTKIGSAVRGNTTRTHVAKTNAEINAARRTGNVVATEKKYTTGNKVSNPEGQRLTKVDRENEVAPPPKIDLSVGKAMGKARQELKLSQADLAKKVNEKQSIINEYEAGKAIPSQQVLGKLERALGVKLRGKDIGSPLQGPKKR